MKMESLRRAYGMAEPIRRGMELKIVRDASFVPMALGGPRRNGGNVHEDILTLGGRDTELGWEDVFHSMILPSFYVSFLLLQVGYVKLSLLIKADDEFREPPTLHDEMEKRLKMDW